MSRKSVTIDEMMNDLKLGTSKMPINSITGLQVDRLYKALSIPSFVHGYSLAIEYIKSWFLGKFKEFGFPDNYFKTVYINGKHVLDDWKYFNKDNIKKEKPMVAIVPSIDFEYDRETVDAYLADPRVFLRKSEYQNSFFKDDEINQYLGMDMRALRMNFAFRIRVSSRAQQLDLLENMKMMFRIGATQSERLSADFHIPKDVMFEIAKRAKFDIDEKSGKIENVMGFISYMNRNSDLPIMFKMRAINQKPEFFVRRNDLYSHLSLLDKLDHDDGERDGHLDNNFHIDMAVTLTIPVPHYYVYFSAHPIKDYLEVCNMEDDKDKPHKGLYQFCNYELPERNDSGWAQFTVSSYMCDKDEKFIDIKDLFPENTNLGGLIKYSLSHFISPLHFMEIRIYKNDYTLKLVRTKTDYKNMKVMINEDIDEEVVYIVAYGDMKYINDTIISINEYDKTRIDIDKSNNKIT